jgi:recombinational DNA repair protein RecR
MLTRATGHLLQTIRYIRLSPYIEVHVRVNGETVTTLETDAAALSIGQQCATVNAKVIRLADGASYSRQALFDLFQ